MPRSYNLGRRAESKADTRSRIVDAALAIYRDRGMAAASNLAIARAADVAPATIRNHFPEEGDLPQAVFEAVLAELQVPTPEIFSGARSLRDSLTRLADAMASFYERSQDWWRAYEREPELINAWGGGLASYYADIEALMRTALGDLGSDERAAAVVASVIGPPTFFALRGRGLSSDDAVALSLDIAVPWLERRRRELRPTPRGGSAPSGRRAGRR